MPWNSFHCISLNTEAWMMKPWIPEQGHLEQGLWGRGKIIVKQWSSSRGEQGPQKHQKSWQLFWMRMFLRVPVYVGQESLLWTIDELLQTRQNPLYSLLGVSSYFLEKIYACIYKNSEKWKRIFFFCCLPSHIAHAGLSGTGLDETRG